MKLSTVDLFCGSGGLSTGFIAAGIDVAAAFDYWDIAIDTYQRNISDHAQLFDLSDVKETVAEIRKYNVDIIAGGPPCQDFSSAGKRVEGKRANLTKAFGEIVSKCKPPYFLMENVPTVRLSDSYKKTKNKLVRAGYEVSEIVIDASFCGVPQSRKRFFAFGSLSDKAPDIFVESVQDRFSDKKMTVKDYFEDEIDIEFYYRHPRNYTRRSVFSVHEPSPTIRGVNRPVPPNYKGNHLDSASPSTVRPIDISREKPIADIPRFLGLGCWQQECECRTADRKRSACKSSLFCRGGDSRCRRVKTNLVCMA